MICCQNCISNDLCWSTPFLILNILYLDITRVGKFFLTKGLTIFFGSLGFVYDMIEKLWTLRREGDIV